VLLAWAALTGCSAIAPPVTAPSHGPVARYGTTPTSCDTAAAGTEPVVPALQSLGAQTWWLPGAIGDSDEVNRALISNLLIVADGDRLWLVGTGPSAAFGRSLQQQLVCRLGRAPTDVISPWPRPELVLGQTGLPGARSWAHADVAAAMAQRCAHCVERLRVRLGRHGADLGEPAIRLPDQLLHGEHGQLGPFFWWRLTRGGDTPVTVWWHPASGILTAHGVLWSDGAPDLRDTRITDMQTATEALQTLMSLQTLTRPLDRMPQWLPEQGPLANATASADHLRYWAALTSAVAQAQAEGRPETDPAPELPGIDPALTRSTRHALNWQRAWRQAEDLSFDVPIDQRGVFQRSLR
jgi:hypothetical protein